ncbi:DNA repair protein RecN [Ulvibacter antarcticus]|uniref:DNA repair protein RecN n=1 Tax=Ulvibacter antarcticus TaxID=442714 RepID=A0A3L9YVX6_9FLAO|nr:DNA repair protein RecN [Ulvibacter antarcticus]RMA64901.1 DNA replication and repair protein RecN [Ulvibacter antarcticus]
MITNLAIKNYALIDDVNVKLHEGLTIITGETGAGKSILLGALGMILGKRADMGSVKNPDKKCVIEGEFSIAAYRLEDVFAANDLDYDAQTIIRREILPGGKSRAFVNDSPVSLSQLQSIAEHLVDIHSQHETLSLASESYQMEVIDALADSNSVLQKYQEKLESFRSITAKISELKGLQETAARELDYHTFLHKELEEANLKGVDIVQIEETYETLSNTEVIQESFSKILQLISEENIGSLETAKEARIALGKIKGFSGTYEEFWNRLNSVIIELEDVFEGMEDQLSNVEADPSKLFEINEKLQTIYKLQQKHSVATVSELLEIQESLSEKIDDTVSMDDRLQKLEKEQITIKEEIIAIGSSLHKKRKEAIPKLKEQLEGYLFELGLPNAQFKFELHQGVEFRKNGIDVLDLLFTANKGLAFGSLKKVASGGEMSRIMLAVKAVLARYKKLPTIIFDEIDTGVSGEIANRMAGILAGMSRSMQLLSITHLPQIAAKGLHHIKVYKQDVEEVTQTRLKSLSQEERIVEIAQMISGHNVTEAAIANAKELLN